MYCQICGNLLDETDPICKVCGAEIEDQEDRPFNSRASDGQSRSKSNEDQAHEVVIGEGSTVAGPAGTGGPPVVAVDDSLHKENTAPGTAAGAAAETTMVIGTGTRPSEQRIDTDAIIQKFREEFQWNVQGFPTGTPEKTEEINFDWSPAAKEEAGREQGRVSQQNNRQPAGKAEAAASQISNFQPSRAQADSGSAGPACANSNAGKNANPAASASAGPVNFAERPAAEAVSGGELKRELFGNGSSLGANPDERERFFTFNQKNEEFQKLLEKEYERLKRYDTEGMAQARTIVGKPASAHGDGGNAARQQPAKADEDHRKTKIWKPFHAPDEAADSPAADPAAAEITGAQNPSERQEAEEFPDAAAVNPADPAAENSENPSKEKQPEQPEGQRPEETRPEKTKMEPEPAPDKAGPAAQKAPAEPSAETAGKSGPIRKTLLAVLIAGLLLAGAIVGILYLMPSSAAAEFLRSVFAFLPFTTDST